MTRSRRAEQITAALYRLVPQIPPFEAQEVISHAMVTPSLRHLAPEKAAWLSLVALVRHLHSDYDALLDEGYGVEAARYCVGEQINAQINQWGGQRSVTRKEKD
jgi:hypothetical protein